MTTYFFVEQNEWTLWYTVTLVSGAVCVMTLIGVAVGIGCRGTRLVILYRHNFLRAIFRSYALFCDIERFVSMCGLFRQLKVLRKSEIFTIYLIASFNL